jgi:hypothetical protein
LILACLTVFFAFFNFPSRLILEIPINRSTFRWVLPISPTLCAVRGIFFTRTALRFTFGTFYVYFIIIKSFRTLALRCFCPILRALYTRFSFFRTRSAIFRTLSTINTNEIIKHTLRTVTFGQIHSISKTFITLSRRTNARFTLLSARST